MPRLATAAAHTGFTPVSVREMRHLVVGYLLSRRNGQLRQRSSDGSLACLLFGIAFRHVHRCHVFGRFHHLIITLRNFLISDCWLLQLLVLLQRRQLMTFVRTYAAVYTYSCLRKDANVFSSVACFQHARAVVGYFTLEVFTAAGVIAVTSTSMASLSTFIWSGLIQAVR